MSKWDSGVPYEELRKRLINKIEYELRKIKEKKVIRRKLGYLVLFAIQLRNGLRISDSIEAFIGFKSNPTAERVSFHVLKKKKDVEVVAWWPRWCPRRALNLVSQHLQGWTPTRLSAANACRRYLDVNTHSLRFARITYLLRKGINPSIVAKMTHHSNLHYILRYTQVKEAQDLAREID